MLYLSELFSITSESFVSALNYSLCPEGEKTVQPRTKTKYEDELTEEGMGLPRSCGGICPGSHRQNEQSCDHCHVGAELLSKTGLAKKKMREREK